MALLKKVLGIVVALVALVFVSGFALPSVVHVERRIVIHATPDAIFPLVSDLSQWERWSPWAKLDPKMDMSITGSALEQTMRWQSEDPRVGSGSQTITAIEAPSYVKTHLDFGSQGVSDAAFRLTPQDDETLVTWSLDADMREGVPTLQQPISTYFGFLMDRMVGQDYEAGLANLKAVVEQS
jgi:hypothetical protein